MNDDDEAIRNLPHEEIDNSPKTESIDAQFMTQPIVCPVCQKELEMSESVSTDLLSGNVCSVC